VRSADREGGCDDPGMSSGPPLDDRLAARRLRDRQLRARRRRLAAAFGAFALAAAAVVVVALSAGHDRDSGARQVKPAPRHGSQQPRPVAARLPPISPARPGAARVVTQGGPRRRVVALTFDDGFCAACVARIVAVLRRTGAHATFFPNGRYALSWAPQARAIDRLIAAGQVTMGNHTFSHLQATAVGPAAFGQDLQRNELWIERTFHVTGRPFVRPPYGAYDRGTLAAAGRLGYTTVVMWSGTVADSSPRTVPYLLNAIRYWARPGAIILMHGNYPATPRALPAMLRILRAKRLRTVTLREMVGG